MNKKALAGNKLMIFAFLLILIIITAGLVLGTWLFFGKEIDFRKVDADILNHKVKKCLSENTIDFSNQDEFYEKCRINKNLKDKDLLILISKDDEPILEAGIGHSTQCSLSDLNKDFPKCTPSTFNDLTILTGSNQKLKHQIG